MKANLVQLYLVVHFMNDLLYTVHIMNTKQKEDTATLEILQAIENRNDVTQRHLADKLDVALGLANSYLKSCVRKGLIKVQQAPANRYLYYLTPKGFTEKSRLTAEYLSSSFDFYRRAGNSLNETLNICESNGWDRILLCGVSGLAEIASIRALEHDIQIIGIYDKTVEKKTILNMTVFNSLSDAGNYDVCLITAFNDISDLYKLLIRKVKSERILVPSILGFSRKEIDSLTEY